MQLGCDIHVSNIYHLYTHFKLAAQRSFGSNLVYVLCLSQPSVTNTQTIERYHDNFPCTRSLTMKYFSTRGGDQKLSFEEVNPIHYDPHGYFS